MKSIKKFDKETIETLRTGCPTAEREAVLRYGDNWRNDYAKNRNKMRSKRFYLLNKIILAVRHEI